MLHHHMWSSKQQGKIVQLCVCEGGKQQGWAKLLKKTESYKEIFNLFDKVRDKTSDTTRKR